VLPDRLKSLRLACLAVTSMVAFGAAIGVTVPAFAQSEGWYVEGGGGVNWLDDIQFDESGAQFELGSDSGWAAGGRVGYGWNNGVRLEGEVTYRDNSDGVASFAGPGGNPAGDGGGADLLFGNPVDVSSLALMGNVYYDIGQYFSITPYVGLGAGALLVEFEDATGRTTDDTVFAAQARAGVNVAITDTLSATVDYTYLRGFDLSEPYCCGALNDDYEAQTVIAGLRYTFMAPTAPPPAPVIAPVVETSFIIFFDWDSASLSAEANIVLDDVVIVVNQTGAASVLLDGYTDLSGSPEYNLGLSERRAQSAADGLIARGIAPDEIVVRAFGEENPLIPTPNGVREPQNRRVEIILG